MEKFKNFLKEAEVWLGTIFISITVVLVVSNVFIRYFFSNLQFAWLEEIAVGCFTWTVFLGATATYRKRNLIGVEAVMLLLPKTVRKVARVIVDFIVIILLSTMAYLSATYVYNSTKITAVLEFSYKFIDVSMFISFILMTIYTIGFTIKDIRSFKDKEDEGLSVSNPDVEEAIQ